MNRQLTPTRVQHSKLLILDTELRRRAWLNHETHVTFRVRHTLFTADSRLPSPAHD